MSFLSCAAIARPYSTSSAARAASAASLASCSAAFASAASRSSSFFAAAASTTSLPACALASSAANAAVAASLAFRVAASSARRCASTFCNDAALFRLAFLCATVASNDERVFKCARAAPAKSAWVAASRSFSRASAAPAGASAASPVSTDDGAQGLQYSLLSSRPWKTAPFPASRTPWQLEQQKHSLWKRFPSAATNSCVSTSSQTLHTSPRRRRSHGVQ